MTQPRLLTNDEVCAALHVSISQLTEFKLHGAPVRLVDGADRWPFGALVEWIAAHEATLWGGVLP